MLFGESHFLIDRYVSILSQVEDANKLSLYHVEYDLSLAKAHLSQGSLFGDRNILIIKSEKKIPKADLSVLLELVKKNSDNIFIYAYYGSYYKTSYSAFTKKSGGEYVRLFNPYFKEARDILMRHAQSLGVELDSYSATHLLQSQNGDIALACNEVEKLQYKQGPITTRDIDEMVYGVATLKMEEFIVKLLAKRDIFDDLKQLVESGEDEIRILTSINRFIYELNLFYIYIKLYGTSDSQKVLGYRLPPFIEKERSSLSISFKQHQYEAMIDTLLEYELKMKQGSKIDKNALLLSCLIKLQALL